MAETSRKRDRERASAKGCETLIHNTKFEIIRLVLFSVLYEILTLHLYMHQISSQKHFHLLVMVLT